MSVNDRQIGSKVVGAVDRVLAKVVSFFSFSDQIFDRKCRGDPVQQR